MMSNVSQTNNPPTWLGDPDPAKGPVIGVSQADINDLHFQIANLKAERDAAYAAGEKAERERCHGIATEWKAKAHSNQRKETDLGVQSMYAASASTAGIIAAAIMENKSDE